MTTDKKFIKTPEGQPDLVELKAHLKSGKDKGRKVTVLLDADDVVRDQVSGFVNFIREHAIVGLAVGFIVGQQAQGVVKQLVNSFIDPTLQLLIGKTLANLSFTLHVGNHTGVYVWGAMVVVLLNLFFVLAVIYALIKIFKLDKLDKQQP
jgi:large-conductance mechanosensitive channel